MSEELFRIGSEDAAGQKNRVVLYELSKVFAKAAKKAQRVGGLEVPPLPPPPPPPPPPPGVGTFALAFLTHLQPPCPTT